MRKVILFNKVTLDGNFERPNKEIDWQNVDGVVRYCRNTPEIMMPGGGYCFAPTHTLQDNSPTENVLAMGDAALTFEKY